MKLSVGATRMELLRLRRRLVLARRGHKLLRDRQQELMRRLLELIAEIRSHRQIVRKETRRVLARFALAGGSFEPKFLDEGIMLPTRRITVEVKTKRVMNLPVPVFKKESTGRMRSYGFATTSGELDLALLSLDRLLDSLFVLAEKEKTLEILAGELEKTRRRVNALEFVLIPSIEETIRAITFKLAESERQDLLRLMRVKETLERGGK
ncbi:MAG: V-type ATP synthase subunit D [candidate division WOR-3 bacterium]